MNDGQAMKICHLVLMGRYYDAIESGPKSIEYRRDCQYWRKRLLDATHVTLHRAYTNITMTFKIKKIVLSTQIEIHLGEREY